MKFYRLIQEILKSHISNVRPYLQTDFLWDYLKYRLTANLSRGRKIPMVIKLLHITYDNKTTQSVILSQQPLDIPKETTKFKKNITC